MKPLQIMIIAGEASGDALAAKLVRSLRRELMAANTVYSGDSQPLRTGLEPRFFGAAGPRMQAEGVELAFDLTQHSVIGISAAIRNYPKFRKLFRQLVKLAIDRRPDAILCVDFSAFNSRFAAAIRAHARHRDWFHPWNPRIIRYVSPQVWASRESRIYNVARDHDLVLSIFPFEPDWYQKRVPNLRVEFVGHPLLDEESPVAREPRAQKANPSLLLLPGSRRGELKFHVPIIIQTLQLIRQKNPQVRAKMVLPTEWHRQFAQSLGTPSDIDIQIGNLSSALEECDLAITKSGTAALECAFHSVPAVVLYKVPWYEFILAKNFVTVRFLAMPNLLADEELYPEYLQYAATPENLSQAALDLLSDPSRRTRIQKRLTEITASFGGPGASQRAAAAVARVLGL
jgi:lipid-A-disaccharide synthase